MAQQNETDYDLQWKKVDDLLSKKGLTGTALTEVNRIYQQAKKEKKHAQVIKALLYQMNLREISEEGFENTGTILNLEKEKTSFAEPVSSILNSILAEEYWKFFQQQRYRIYDRTETVNFNKADPATWTINDFHKKISALYLASIQNKKLLQQTSLAPYDAIIVKGNARFLRPTLYDLLAHRALGYFRSDERDIDKPSYAFQINDDALFLPAEDFIKLGIQTNDSLSLHHKALLICQDLLRFHLADVKHDAFIDADIIRIEIVNQYATQHNKDTLYAKALDALFTKYPKEPAAARAAGLLAQWHVNKALTYEPLKDSSNRFEYLEALKICEKAIAQPQQSEGKSYCLALINQIKQKEVNLQTEKVNLPGKPFRTLVSFRNFTKLFLRIIPLSTAQQQQLSNRYDENYWKEITALPAVRTWDQDFPATGDYQKHSSEIKIDALPTGNYILLAGTNENFIQNRNPLAVQFFYVSGISYINSGRDYFVLDRDNGRPLPNATVQVWNYKYDPARRRNTYTKGEQSNTDNNGYFQVSNKPIQADNFQLEIQHKTDNLFLKEYQYRTYRNENEDGAVINAAAYEKEQARVFFFTDRSIYRPGQTVYFKGIVITKDHKTGRSKLFVNGKTTIALDNPNGENKDSLQVTTNAFGSVTGNFKIPENTLNGSFLLRSTGLQGTASFSVEEYKRPRFYAEFEKLNGSYRINDTITVNGLVKAYAGNNMEGARVKYRVVRKPRFIYPWMFRKTIMPVSAPMEITHGTATTTAEGRFTIHFKAIPDLTLNPKLEPVFDYEVMADITDVNGETRSVQKIIPVSYKAIQLKVSIPPGKVLPVDSLQNMLVRTENLNGEFLPSIARVSIYRLQSPDRLIRQRYWQQPDMHVLSRESYLRDFPLDEYEDEASPDNWQKGKAVYERSDSTSAGGLFGIKTNGLTSGWYSVEVVTTDNSGGEIKDIRTLQLYDGKNIPAATYAWNVQEDGTIEPGEKSNLTIGSTANDLFVIQHVQKQDMNQGQYPARANPGNSPIPGYTFISLGNEKKSFGFTAAEEDRGGFGVYHFFVKNNRFYGMENLVNVPWTNKDLVISYETFRDKTLPGSGEKWNLKISGYKNEKVAAEMLASMYDASLDQFKMQKWELPDIWPSFSTLPGWNGQQNFSAIQSEEKYTDPEQEASVFSNVYDQLLSFPGRSAIRMRGQRNMAAAAPAVQESSMGNADMLKAKVPGMATGNTATFDLALAEAGLPAGQPTEPSPFQARKNFNETAFFFPDLKTDSAGNISFGFTIPEALTRWKFQALAHTSEAAFGYSTKDIITQKQLMVQPNAPRFFREGDQMQLSTKVVNMTDKELTGTIHLELLNAADMHPVDGWFQNMTANQYFTAEAGKTVVANFSIQVPYQYNSAVVYRFIAKADSAGISDGEEASLPVLTNSMLVTETLPLNLQGNTTKKFRFEKLLQSGASETLQQHALTVEFSTNPAWYAVQALPYLAEKVYQSSEQQFNNFYANALATKIANGSPRIQAIFEKWKASASDPKQQALLSNLEKNAELKTALLEETPWLLEAKSESQQKKNIALLFDMAKMKDVLQSSITALQQAQTVNGGFSWFRGGPDDRFITQYIITGIGHLKQLGALPPSGEIDNITRLGIAYLDKRMEEDYANLLKLKPVPGKSNISALQVQYLYMRSFFSEIGIPGPSFNAVNFYRKQSQQYWVQQNRYMQGMIALALNRSGDKKTAEDIMKSLKQNAVVSNELGTYWKENHSSYFWYQAPVETQSLLIEAFSEITKDNKFINGLKTWLVQQKQTQRWPSTKATADACYALLLQGSDWLSAEPAIEINLGTKSVKSSAQQQEAGTGYFKTIFNGPFVNPSMGEITVNVSRPPSKEGAVSNEGSGYGAVYWQYFEKLDKITPSATPLQLTKKLFVEKNSDRGPVLAPIAEGAYIKVGDKVKVRIELRVDRDMEYVHLKDMRAVCMEPVNVLSSYKYQGGLGYYESTKDASTSFFFNWLPKGVYVFEYALVASQAGNFSNGVSSIQCMYAPEFSSYSEGIRVNVE